MVRRAHTISLVLVVNTIVDYLTVLFVRQRPAGDVVAVVLGSTSRPVQVRRLCARPIGHAVHGHGAAASVVLSLAYWRWRFKAWGGRYAGNAIGYDDATILAI